MAIYSIHQFHIFQSNVISLRNKLTSFKVILLNIKLDLYLDFFKYFSLSFGLLTEFKQYSHYLQSDKM